MDLSRLEILVGRKNIEILNNSTVAVIGLGGVGGICAESLVRCGIGRLFICDGDVVEPSNINRQIVAKVSTIGINKAIALKRRLIDINPDAEVIAIDKRWNLDNNFLAGEKIDFVVAGSNPGSKYEKAVSLGLNILDEKQFLNIIKN